MRPFSRETIIDRRQSHLRWSAVIGGTALAIGLWILLQTLGMGIGLSAVDVDDAGNLKGIGIGTGVWSLIAPLIAMFLGALLVGRLCGSRDRKVGAMHGSVMWALSLVIGLWAMFSLVSALASGVSRIGGAAVSAGTAAVSGAASNVEPGKAMSALGIDANDLIAPINERLAREGKPQVTPEQLQNTLKAVAQRGVREGRLDRQLVVQEVARNTALTGADAEDVANEIETRYEQASSKVQGTVEQVGEKAKTVALTAADKTGKALLFGGIMMLLSLGAALLGGALGVRRRLSPDDAPPLVVNEADTRTTATTTRTAVP
jgi:hypothetical protein